MITFYNETDQEAVHTLHIREQFFGLNSNANEIKVSSQLDGTLPNIDPDAQIVIKDHKQEYDHYAQGS